MITTIMMQCAQPEAQLQQSNYLYGNNAPTSNQLAQQQDIFNSMKMSTPSAIFLKIAMSLVLFNFLLVIATLLTLVLTGSKGVQLHNAQYEQVNSSENLKAGWFMEHFNIIFSSIMVFIMVMIMIMEGIHYGKNGIKNSIFSMITNMFLGVIIIGILSFNGICWRTKKDSVWPTILHGVTAGLLLGNTIFMGVGIHTFNNTKREDSFNQYVGYVGQNSALQPFAYNQMSPAVKNIPAGV